MKDSQRIAGLAFSFHVTLVRGCMKFHHLFTLPFQVKHLKPVWNTSTATWLNTIP